MSRTLKDVCQQDYFPKRISIRSKNTTRQYLYAIENFSRFLGRPATLDDLDEDTLTAWLKSLMDSGLAIDTCREKVRRVTALWNWCAKRRLVHMFPTLTLPPAPDPVPVAWTEDELRRLFDSARRENKMIGGVPGWLWWPAWLTFIYCTGERFGAAIRLRWEWLDLQNAMATIPANVRKGGRKRGVYWLWPECVALLRQIQEPRRELVFPWDRCQAMYWSDFNRILKRAGLPTGRKYKTHGLRATHATMVAVLGGDPSKSLMHGDDRTTKRHYIDPTKLRPHKMKLPLPLAEMPSAEPPRMAEPDSRDLAELAWL
jgi:integrase